MTDHNKLFRSLLLRDLANFVAKCFDTLEPGARFEGNFHIDAMCYELHRVLTGESTRLLVEIAPRYLKSMVVTIAFTAWALGHNPRLKIMCISYSKELARTHALAFRQSVESDWYRALFPRLQVRARNQRIMELTTTEGGYRFASSVDGSVLGRGADIIIIDDPMKVQDALSEAGRRKAQEFFRNTGYSRLNDKRRGRIVVVGQRLHVDDLIGHIESLDSWTKLSIPAIETADRLYRVGLDPRDVYLRRAGAPLHPARESHEELDRIRRNLGSMMYSAQYQQQPVPQEGAVIKRSWLRFYDTRPETFDLVVISWDTASTLEETSDFSVGTVWGLKDNSFFLLEVVRERLETPDLRRKVLEIHQRWDATTTVIEDSDIGRALVQELRRSNRLRPLLRKPRFDKQARLLMQSARFEAGEVLLPREAPWLAVYLEELLSFPNARHDDQVDSTSQALDWLSIKRAQTRPGQRPNPPRPLGLPRRRTA